MCASRTSATMPIRAARPTWACFPICCLDMCLSSALGAFAQEYAGMPATPGKTQPEMFAAAANGGLGALLVVGANPLRRRRR